MGDYRFLVPQFGDIAITDNEEFQRVRAFGGFVNNEDYDLLDDMKLLDAGLYDNKKDYSDIPTKNLEEEGEDPPDKAACRETSFEMQAFNDDEDLPNDTTLTCINAYDDVNVYYKIYKRCLQLERDYGIVERESEALNHVFVRIVERFRPEVGCIVQFTKPSESSSKVGRLGEQIQIISMTDPSANSFGRIISPPKYPEGNVDVMLTVPTEVTEEESFGRLIQSLANSVCSTYIIKWEYDETTYNRAMKAMKKFRYLTNPAQGGVNKVRHFDRETRLPIEAMDTRVPQVSELVRDIVLNGGHKNKRLQKLQLTKREFDNSNPGYGGLNVTQSTAIECALGNVVSVIQGPPGTGKSKTACSLIKFLFHLFEDIENQLGDTKTILVTGPSNISVDNLCESIAIDPELAPHCIRLCSQAYEYGGNTKLKKFSVHSRIFEPENYKDSRYCPENFYELSKRKNDSCTKQDVEPLSKTEQNQYKRIKAQFERNLMRLKYRIVFATCSGCGDFRLKGTFFDFVIIDEAAQETEPVCLIPFMRLKFSGQIALFGDHQQLGPVVQNNAAINMNFELTLFERLIRNKIPYVRLVHQYRMHPGICELTNDINYNGELIDQTSVENRTIMQVQELFEGDQTCPIAWINTSHPEKRSQDHSIENEGEVEQIVRLLNLLIIEKEIQPQRLGIICSYGAQFRALTTARDVLPYRKETQLPPEKMQFVQNLSHVDIATVNNFQGREKDIIIFSICRSNKSGNIGFLSDIRWLNVVISRPKCFLIIVGNATMFGSSGDDESRETWHQLYNKFLEKNRIMSFTNGLYSPTALSSTNNWPFVEITQEMKRFIEPPFLRDRRAYYGTYPAFENLMAGFVKENEEEMLQLPGCGPPLSPYIKFVNSVHNQIRLQIHPKAFDEIIAGNYAATVGQTERRFNVTIQMESRKFRKIDGNGCIISGAQHSDRLKALATLSRAVDKEFEDRKKFIDRFNDPLETGGQKCKIFHYPNPTDDKLKQALQKGFHQHLSFVEFRLRHDCVGDILSNVDHFLEKMRTEYLMQVKISKQNKREFVYIWCYPFYGEKKKLTNDQLYDKLMDTLKSAWIRRRDTLLTLRKKVGQDEAENGLG